MRDRKQELGLIIAEGYAIKERTQHLKEEMAQLDKDVKALLERVAIAVHEAVKESE